MQLKKIWILLFLFLILSPVYAIEKPSGEIILIKGIAEVMRVDNKDWTRLKIKEKVYEGDTIKTGSDSYTQIKFPLESIRVHEKSKFKITELSQKEKEKSFLYFFKRKTIEKNDKIEVFMGKVYNKIKKLKKEEKSEIKTSASIFGVYGTSYELVVGEQNISLYVTDGEVKVYDLANPELFKFIKEGQSLITGASPGQQYEQGEVKPEDLEEINEFIDTLESSINENENIKDENTGSKQEDGSAKPSIGTVKIKW